MTEHSAVIFVFFFLAEYASIVLMCILISILFLGGYNFNYSIISSLIVFIYNIYDLFLDYFIPFYVNTKSALHDAYNYIVVFYDFPSYVNNTPVEPYNSGITDINAYKQYYSDLLKHSVDTYFENLLSNPLTENIVYALVIGIKTAIMIFVFI
jgi:hypothetical protein